MLRDTILQNITKNSQQLGAVEEGARHGREFLYPDFTSQEAVLNTI